MNPPVAVSRWCWRRARERGCAPRGPKVLHEIANASMLAHVLAAVQAAGADGLAVVVGPDRADVAGSRPQGGAGRRNLRSDRAPRHRPRRSRRAPGAGARLGRYLDRLRRHAPGPPGNISRAATPWRPEMRLRRSASRRPFPTDTGGCWSMRPARSSLSANTRTQLIPSAPPACATPD